MTSRSWLAVLAAVTTVAVVTPAASAAVPAPTSAPTRIHDVQGATRLSPLVGRPVTGVPGVVTAVRTFGSSRGFWFQDPQPDADPATSEGLFVFTRSTTPAVAVGDSVLVGGTVAEFYPGGDPAGTAQQSVTELTGATWTVASAGNPVPAAEVLDPATVPEALAPDVRGGSIEKLTLDPSRYALDFYESREGMRLQVSDARVVGRTDEFNGLWVTSKPGQNPTARGGTLYASYNDPNSGRLKIESLIPFAQRPFPKADVGDRLTGVTDGPLDYTNFGGYVLEASTLGPLASGGLVHETVTPARPAQLSVGTYNVENLFPGDNAAKFTRLAQGIVTNMRSPDVVALEEIQDDTGPTDDGVVTAGVTLQRFVDAIVTAGGPRYEARSIDPVNDQDGGQPGGNIRVAFLVNPARVQFVDRPGGGSTAAVRAVRAGRLGVALSSSPGRVAPTDPAWEDSRKPLAGEFRFHGRTVFVIANHFVSKGADQPFYGRFQPPNRSSEIQRTRQATVLRSFTDSLLRLDPTASVVALGDLNDYPFSPALAPLTGRGGLTDLITRLPPAERYSYVFDGNSQTLDHIVTSRSVVLPQYDVVHINAEFADQASDHDPQVMRFVPLGGLG